MPKRGDQRITVTCLRAGQPRPHADSVYEYVITAEHVPQHGPNKTEFVPFKIPQTRMIELAKVLCRPFKTPDEKPEWHETQLQSFTPRGDGVWQLILKQEYTG